MPQTVFARSLGALALLVAPSAYSQSVGGQPVGDPNLVAPPVLSQPSTTGLPDDVEYQAGPRLWYFSSTGGALKQSVNLGTTPPKGRIFTLGDFSYLMAGATASARFSQLPETTFLLSGLYGTTSQTTRTVDLAQQAVAVGTVPTERTDLEFLAQTAIPGTTAGWIIGGRLEYTTQRATITTRSVSSPIPMQSFSPASVYIPSLKVGLAAATPINSEGTLRVFGNAMLAAGIFIDQTGVSTGQIGPDMSVGLQYAITPDITFDARYRVLVNVYTDQKPLGDRYAINHGPLIGLTMKFPTGNAPPPLSTLAESAPPSTLAESARPQSSSLLDDAEYQAGPRLWYFSSTGGALKQSVNLGTTPPKGRIFTLGDFSYLMAGATASARFSQLPETTFLLSGLYGTTSQTTRTVDLAQQAVAVGTVPTERTDLEFLAQTAIPGTTAGWIIGGRLEYTTQRATITTRSVSSPIPMQSFSPASVYIPSLKVGLAAATPINSEGTLRVFGNAMLAAGIFIDQTGVSTGQIGPDMSVGLQYAITPDITFDARYRVLVNVYTDQKPLGDRYAINHGPLIGLTMKF